MSGREQANPLAQEIQSAQDPKHIYPDSKQGLIQIGWGFFIICVTIIHCLCYYFQEEQEGKRFKSKSNVTLYLLQCYYF